MENSIKTSFSRLIYLLIILSGFATLSWEVIWQIKSTLALGESALGTAITLAIVMGGMSVGGLLMGKALNHDSVAPAIRLYGLLELIAGIAGLLLNLTLHGLEKFDVWAYSGIPNSMTLIYLVGIIIIIGIPTIAIGATLPVFGLISKEYQLSIAKLYSLNTLGAALGVLIMALILIPLFGITHTSWLIAAVNIAIGLSALLFIPVKQVSNIKCDTHQFSNPSLSNRELVIVSVTGFAIFTLEVAWFRSLSSTFVNTTDNFAIILACTLIALGLAAKKVTKLKKENKLLGPRICFGGILIFLVTILIERLDFIFPSNAIATKDIMLNFGWLVNQQTFAINGIAISIYVFQLICRFILITIVIVPPIFFLGIAFPWLLDNQRSSYNIGKLYAVNTLAAIIGSISSAWLLLPTIGFAKTAWLAGLLVVIAGIIAIPSQLKRLLWTGLSISALLLAMYFEADIGTKRILGFFSHDSEGNPAKILAYYEGRAATSSAIEYKDGSRALLINGTLAAWESGKTYRASAHYMAAMGYLPMLLHANPKKALVICFGTGQTANAVRKENPKELDIVDINPNVFKLAHNFRSNEDVISDRRVKTIVMDGRAYLRRTKKMYDVITLEPMPPSAMGVNALYSKEFYQLARNRLEPKGVIAQWLPFHIVAPHYTASIAKTFIDVFPNAILWIDPDSKIGILLGSKDNDFPGFASNRLTRYLSHGNVEEYIALNAEELKRYSTYGEIISDDNQLLSYGKALYISNLLAENFNLLHQINRKIKIPYLGTDFR